MSRAKWKGSFVEKFTLNKLNKKFNLNIWSRKSIISSNFIDKKVFVWNGNSFKPVFVTREKVGFKFGEFCTTRNIRKNKKKGSKKKIKK